MAPYAFCSPQRKEMLLSLLESCSAKYVFIIRFYLLLLAVSCPFAASFFFVGLAACERLSVVTRGKGWSSVPPPCLSVFPSASLRRAVNPALEDLRILLEASDYLAFNFIYFTKRWVNNKPIADGTGYWGKDYVSKPLDHSRVMIKILSKEDRMRISKNFKPYYSAAYGYLSDYSVDKKPIHVTRSQLNYTVFNPEQIRGRSKELYSFDGHNMTVGMHNFSTYYKSIRSIVDDLLDREKGLVVRALIISTNYANVFAGHLFTVHLLIEFLPSSLCSATIHVEAVSSRHTFIPKVARTVLIPLGMVIIVFIVISFSKSQFESIVNNPQHKIRSVLVLTLIAVTGYLLVTSMIKYESAFDFAYTPFDQYTPAHAVYQRVTSDSIVLSTTLLLLLLDGAISVRLYLGISTLDDAFYSCIRFGFIFSQIGCLIVLPVLVYFEGRDNGLTSMPSYAHALGIEPKNFLKGHTKTGLLLKAVVQTVAIILTKFCVGMFAGKYLQSEKVMNFPTRIALDTFKRKNRRSKRSENTPPSPKKSQTPTDTKPKSYFSILQGKFGFLWS